MEWGLLRDFFWNFSMRGESAHTRWEMVTRGRRKGRMPMRDENVHAKYEPPSEILHSLIFVHFLRKQSTRCGWMLVINEVDIRACSH